MSDNAFWTYFWLSAFTMIIGIGFMIYLTTCNYTDKIVSIERHEYVFKFPEGKTFIQTRDIKEMKHLTEKKSRQEDEYGR